MFINSSICGSHTCVTANTSFCLHRLCTTRAAEQWKTISFRSRKYFSIYLRSLSESYGTFRFAKIHVVFRVELWCYYMVSLQLWTQRRRWWWLLVLICLDKYFCFFRAFRNRQPISKQFHWVWAHNIVNSNFQGDASGEKSHVGSKHLSRLSFLRARRWPRTHEEVSKDQSIKFRTNWKPTSLTFISNRSLLSNRSEWLSRAKFIRISRSANKFLFLCVFFRQLFTFKRYSNGIL